MARDFVTVVAGVPRSGTSLAMQMLRAGGMRLVTDALRPPDVDNPRGYHEFGPARRLPCDAEWVTGAVGAAVKVVHVLVPSLPTGPAYRVVLMRRRMAEVMASQRAMLERLGRLGAAGPGDERMAEVLSAQLDEVERWAAGRRDVALLRLDYNALVADPAAGSAELAAFLGGGLDEAAMAAAVEPSLYRRRGDSGP